MHERTNEVFVDVVTPFVPVIHFVHPELEKNIYCQNLYVLNELISTLKRSVDFRRCPCTKQSSVVFVLVFTFCENHVIDAFLAETKNQSFVCPNSEDWDPFVAWWKDETLEKVL